MSFKVVRNAAGAVVAFGPDSDGYEPTLAEGCLLSVETEAPAPAAPTKEQQIAAMLADKGVSRVMVQTVIVASEAYAAAKLIALPTLYTANKTYRMAKDLEAAIIALEKAP